MNVSIIIPTYNRSSALFQALTSICTVTGSTDRVEIIIVDNGSIDETANVFREIKSRFPKHSWRYLYDETPGLLTGRHLGAKEAHGEILAFLDDDVLLAPSWIEALREAFRDPDVTFVGGPVRPLYQIEPPSWLTGMWDVFGDGIRVLGGLSLIDQGENQKPTSPLFVPGGNCAIRKTVFKACGGFHPDTLPRPLLRYVGDGEIGLAHVIKAQGLKALYHPGMAVKHLIPVWRLAPAYFEERAFCEGIWRSYTSVRRNGSASSKPTSWRDLFRPVKWKFERKNILQKPTWEGVRLLVARARLAGFWFHQKEVLKDQKLLEWIVRPDYFDYTLPEGWQSFMSDQTSLSQKTPES
jgi:glycosyltransferase involved in cell wall biosynthesis